MISQVFGISGIVSIAFYSTFIASFALWVCTMTEKIDSIDILAITTMVLAAVNVCVDGILEYCSFSFEYIKKLIIFCCSLAFFSASRKIIVPKLFFKTVRFLFMLIGAVYVLMFFARNSQMHILGGSYSSYLTFRFTNPNLAALFLSGMIMYLLSSMTKTVKLDLMEILCFVIMAFEIAFIIQTKSRNVILPMLLFAAGLIWCVVFRKTICLSKGVIAALVLLPLIAALVYLAVVNVPSIERVFGFLSGEGKGLDAREVVWNYAIRWFLSSPLIGAYYSAGHGKGFFQLHNSHLDVLTSYGSVVFILFCVFLFMLLCRQTSEPIDRKRLRVLAFICMLLNGIGEAAMFSGGLCIYLLAGIFLAREKEEPMRVEYSDRRLRIPAKLS